MSAVEVRVPGEREIRAKKEEFYAFFCRSENMDLFRKLGEQKEGKDFVNCNYKSNKEHRRMQRLRSHLIQGRLWKWAVKGAAEVTAGGHQVVTVPKTKEEELR